MALTRFYDDDARVKKKLDESLNVGLYHLDTPGNGIKVPFLEDPQIRLQKWGANLRTNTMALDNDLRGLNRKLKNDQEVYTKYTPITGEVSYPKEGSIVDESRATHPAWMFRDKNQERWFHSFHKVQEKAVIPFEYNSSSRDLAKNNYVTGIPVVDNKKDQEFYLTGKSICLGGQC